MRWSRWSKAAVLLVPVVVAVLVGAQPASADITVDSAICLHQATGTLTSERPVILPDDDPVLEWTTANVQTMYCRGANAVLKLVLDNQDASVPLPAAGSADVFFPGLWKLRLRTSLGQKDLAWITVTID